MLLTFFLVVEYCKAEYRPSCRPELVEGRARETTT
jgi:hypothetical protein